MEISVDKTESETVVCLTGELNIYEVQDLHQRLQTVLPEVIGGLRLTLEKVLEIDTAGIQLLLCLRAEMAQRGLNFVIDETCEAVKTALATYDLPETL